MSNVRQKNVDLGTVKRFDRKGIASVDDMAFYANKGVRPRVVKRLRKGFKGYGALNPEQTKALVTHASTAGYVLSKYGKVTTYCRWQKNRGFSKQIVKENCELITPG